MAKATVIRFIDSQQILEQVGLKESVMFTIATVTVGSYILFYLQLSTWQLYIKWTNLNTDFYKKKDYLHQLPDEIDL